MGETVSKEQLAHEAAQRAQQEKFDTALAEAKKQRELEEAMYKRRQAEAEAKKEAEEFKQQQREADLKEQAEERQQEIERRHEHRMQELQAHEKERREEERRRREEIEKRFEREQEKQKREAEILKREREDAAETQREILREMHSRDQEHSQNMMKLQAEMHKTSLQAQKEKEEHKEELESSHMRHDQMMNLMTQQLQIQKEQNDKLMQNLGDLMQQFTQSRNDFLSYVKEKPESDIIIPEDMQETMRKAKEDLKLDTANCYNFAFVGHTKTGKSSLINAIRGIEDTHPDAADKCLCAFDCLIIVTQDTLGKEEIDFAIKSLKYNQPIAFVRSRCDIVLHNAKLRKEIKKIDQQAIHSYISQMTNFYIKEIQRTKKPELTRVPCFFVSAYTLRDLINGDEVEAVYHEKALLDYIKAKSQFSRNNVS
uniref:G domain-containing protein n=1 Tax=Panagrolaimus davidi TaxID=227884 RepID=A0A914QWW4_9BILA